MRSPLAIATEIVAREGGFVNDSDDPGGATNHGVTIHTARRLGLDLDRDGDIDVHDVRLISADLARDLFLEEYFKRPGISRLPEPLHATVFDMNINAGSAAVKILQSLINKVGVSEPVLVDGAVGPQTTRASFATYDRMGDLMVDAYGIERRRYYYALADRRPKSRKYARRRDGGKGGWITRAEEFIRPKYHLTDDQHAARISAW